MQVDLENAITLDGIFLFSDKGRRWIESQTGGHMPSKVLCSFGLQWQNPRQLYTDSNSISQGTCQLPPRSIVEKHVSTFCSSIQGIAFPVISKSIFDTILDLAYDPSNTRTSSSAKACVFASLALTSLMNRDTSEIMSTETYALMTATFIPQILQEVSTEGLQTLVTLVRRTDSPRYLFHFTHPEDD